MTDGARGGTANGRHFDAAPLPGPIADTYGAGDTFGCTLCFALGRGDDLDDALALAARESAEVLTLRGPYRELADAGERPLVASCTCSQSRDRASQVRPVASVPRAAGRRPHP